VVIVPTRSDFVEGFNKVVAEGVLAGRPVIASSVCPALDYVRDAVIKVSADDVEGYRNAIVRLCDDAEFYESTRRHCAAVRSQFFIANNGWGAALRKTLQKLRLVAEGQPQSLPATLIALSEADHSMAAAISS
jgi:glycosyltransferase involved in cell wall biosynthesis